MRYLVNFAYRVPASIPGQEKKKVANILLSITHTKHVDPDETPQNAASHQGLHCLPLI